MRNCGEKLQRSIRTLEACLAEAFRAEAEVWDRLQLLTESQRTLRHCLHEGREAHRQVCGVGLLRALVCLARVHGVLLLRPPKFAGQR